MFGISYLKIIILWITCSRPNTTRTNVINLLKGFNFNINKRKTTNEKCPLFININLNHGLDYIEL